MWDYRGQKRPSFAQEPAAGQESVWDYPRLPLVKACNRMVVVLKGETTLARSTETVRIMETASPPGFYIPEKDVHL